MGRGGDQDQGQDHDYGDVNAPIYCPDQTFQTCALYANGVKLQSPVSRSAHWVEMDKNNEPQRGSTMKSIPRHTVHQSQGCFSAFKHPASSIREKSSECRVQREEKGGRTFLSAISISGMRNWKITITITIRIKILKPASSIEFHDLWNLQRISASSIQHRASRIEYQASSIQHRASSIQHHLFREMQIGQAG